jgi:predicted nucleic acid-binding Zn ribbon protein
VDDVDNRVTQSGSKPTSGEESDPPPHQKSEVAADSSTTEGVLSAPRGSDLARDALRAAQASARARGRGRSGSTSGTGSLGRRRRRWSSAKPDERDPQPLGRLASRLAANRGWTGRLAGGQVINLWPSLVGAEVAEHTEAIALADGELTVRADSTAWATQLRLLQRQLLAKIAAEVGDGVVRRLKVQGPSAPSWRHGSRHVPGRGPRDTYG